MLRIKQVYNNILRRFGVAVALFLIILPAIHPFTLGEMPRTDDGSIHVYRVIALEHAIITTGNIYPRYVPGLAYGYGAPLFNYFPPVPYYAPLSLALLGLGYVQAWLVAVCFYTYLSAIGAYLLGKVWSNSLGGFATSLSYIYAPYLLFDTVTRGTIIEFAGLAILPFVLWSLTQLAQTKGRFHFLQAIILFAIFIPLHNVVTLHSAILIAFYALMLIGLSRTRWHTFWQLFLVGILGVLLTSFFWLPALTETDQVKINVVTSYLAHIDVTHTLREMPDILALPQISDPQHLQAPIPITLSWLGILFTSLGLCLSWRKNDKVRTLMIFMSLATLIIIFLNTPASIIIWQTIPLLDYTQFAWRTLGIASLTLALTTGVAMAEIGCRITSKKALTAVLSVFTAMTMLYSLSWLYTLYIELPAESIQDVHNYERNTNELALSSYSEYLPITNQSPLDSDALFERYTKSDVIPRSQHPAIREAHWMGTSAQITIVLDTPETLVFDWLYVEGWQAYLDMTPLPLYPQPPEGLVAIDLPAGEYTFTVQLENTPRQQLGNNISMGAIILVVLAVIGLPHSTTSTPVTSSDAPKNIVMAIIITSLGMFALKVVYIDHHPTIWRAYRFAEGIERGIKTPLLADFSNGIRIIGVSMPENVQNGGKMVLEVVAELSATPLSTDYSSQITLRNAENFVVAQTNSFMPGGIATSRWLPGTYTSDTMLLEVSPFTPPGIYTLEIHYYNPITQEIASLLNEAGNPSASTLTLGTVSVTYAQHNVQLMPEPEHILESHSLGMTHSIPLPDVVTVGDIITLGILWHSLDALIDAYAVEFVWRETNTDYKSPPMPLVADYSTTHWQKGDVWQGLYRLIVPPNLTQEHVALGLRLVDTSGTIQSSFITLGQIEINVPERNYELPQNHIEDGRQWSNGIEFIGYETQHEPDDSVTILTLYWRTQRALEQNLRLFVQVFDAEERIIAQTDEVPVNWSRPTTGWADGEIITTQHTLMLPKSAFETNEVRLGWYDAVTTQRERTLDGSDFLRLRSMRSHTE